MWENTRALPLPLLATDDLDQRVEGIAGGDGIGVLRAPLTFLAADRAGRTGV